MQDKLHNQDQLNLYNKGNLHSKMNFTPYNFIQRVNMN